MIRNRIMLVRAYSDILGFWGTCDDKTCRRSRRCGDRTGQCWTRRYPCSGLLRAQRRARIVKKRRKLPASFQAWRRKIDPGDTLL
jgi:hypothetical protein